MFRSFLVTSRFYTRRLATVRMKEMATMAVKTESIVTPTASILESVQAKNSITIEETPGNATTPVLQTVEVTEAVKEEEEVVDPERYRYVHDNPRSFKGRLGYACVNTFLRKQKPSVFCARTCRLDTALKKGNEYVRELALANVADLKTMIQWNEDNKIRFMRISSDMFPFASHEKVGYEVDFAAKELAEVGELANKYNHRLTMHPGQYNQLVSRNPTVVENTIRELHYHAHMMDLMGLNQDSVMIIHMGGVYGDREASLARFEQVYEKLPEHIKRRLVLENDELGYSVSDLLPICQKLKIPLVLDWHHHYINPGTITDLPALLPEIHKTWYDKNITPKEHYSESRNGAVTQMEKRAHSDRVQNLPPTTDDVDLMIEAKDKEQAVFQLYKLYDLETVDDEVWIPQTGVESKQTKGRKSVKSRKRKAQDEEGDLIEEEEEILDEEIEVTETRRTTRRSAAAAAAKKLKMEEEAEEVAQSKPKSKATRKKTKKAEVDGPTATESAASAEKVKKTKGKGKAKSARSKQKNSDNDKLVEDEIASSLQKEDVPKSKKKTPRKRKTADKTDLNDTGLSAIAQEQLPPTTSKVETGIPIEIPKANKRKTKRKSED